MLHNFTSIIALGIFPKKKSVMEKALVILDYYLSGPDKHPWGCIQQTGPLPLEGGLSSGFKWMARMASARAVSWMVISEDLPSPDNRVFTTEGGKLRTQLRAHQPRGA